MRPLLVLLWSRVLVNISSMPCAHPVVVRRGRTIEKDSSGRIYNPAGSSFFLAPCGKCDYCKQQKLDGIVQRLQFEFDSTYQTLFVTYTYDDDHVCQNLSKSDAKTMISDLKNTLNRAYGTWKDGRLASSFKFKYFLVGEYGEKRGRVHMHLLLFLPKSVDWHLIQSSNRFGYICDIQVAGKGSLYYVAEYCVKSLVSDDNVQYQGKSDPFYLQSNGIGISFVNSRLGKSLRMANSYEYRDAKGYKHILPKYLRNKTFDYFQRQAISDKIADELRSRQPHSVQDRNLLLDNLDKKLSRKVQKTKQHYKSSLL